MNKLIVISGGTKGIGRAILERFASQQFDIVTCARSTSELKTLKLEIEAKYGVGLNVYQVDVSKKTEVDGFAQEIIKLDRPIDVLINNAGYFEPGLMTEEPEGTLQKMMDTNLYSAYHLTRGLIQKMKEAKDGHIFSICSVASLIAYPNGGSYSISKFALLGFSKVLREELKSFSIRVTAVMAGATFTASWEGAGIPKERFMKPEDVAEAVFSAYSMSKQTVVEELIIRPQLGDI